MVDVNALNNPALKAKAISLDEIFNNWDLYPFDTLSVNTEIIIGNDVIYYLANETQQIVYANSYVTGKRLDLDEKYYQEHQNEINSRLIELLKIVNVTSMTFDDELYNVELLKAACQNPKINRITIENHTLTKEEYEIVKNSKVKYILTDDVVSELEYEFDDRIAVNQNKLLIQDMNYELLQSNTPKKINANLTEKEIQNFKYINDDARIEFSSTDYENIFKAIDVLKSSNKPNDICITVQKKDQFDNKNIFNEYILNNPDVLDKYNDITVEVGIEDKYSLVNYIRYEKRLIELIKPALDLSPLERYLYAYNVVKKFKEYKESEEDRSSARNIYEILDNDYMVCVGYSALLRDLLTKLGIESREYHADLELSLSKIPLDATVIPDDIEEEHGAHARVEVHIVDPKYGIDAYYIGDPTWDNVLTKDTYNYALMSQDEYNGIDVDTYISIYNVDELFFVHSIEEFYQKVNFWLDKSSKDETYENPNEQKDIEKYKTAFKSFMEILKNANPEIYEHYNMAYKNLYTMTAIASNIKSFHQRMAEVVEKLDNPLLRKSFNGLKAASFSLDYHEKRKREKRAQPLIQLVRELIDSFNLKDTKMYEYLKEKYDHIKVYGYELSKEEFQEFLYEVGTYIVSKVNKPIPGEVLVSAISVLYHEKYMPGEENIDETIAHIVEYNKKRQEKCFPTKYEVLDDGTKVPIINEHNKFDLDPNSYKGRAA